jgi:hypothetical protein
MIMKSNNNQRICQFYDEINTSWVTISCPVVESFDESIVFNRPEHPDVFLNLDQDFHGTPFFLDMSLLKRLIPTEPAGVIYEAISVHLTDLSDPAAVENTTDITPTVVFTVDDINNTIQIDMAMETELSRTPFWLKVHPRFLTPQIVFDVA